MGHLKHRADIGTCRCVAEPGLRALAIATATAMASSLPSVAGAGAAAAPLPLLASTLLGGRNEDSVADMALGPDGSIYLLMQTQSVNMPTTPGAFDRSYNRPGDGEFGGDAFVARLTPDAGALIYATYLGGTDSEYPRALAVGPGGEAYVTGHTYSANFPTTPGAYAETFAGGCCDVFVTAIDPAGRMLWSTFFGGTVVEAPGALALTASGEVVIAGDTLSPDLPTTPLAWDRTLNNGDDGYNDAFVARLDASGSRLLWATYLGGGYNDDAQAVAVALDGRIIVGGRSMASDYPTTPGAYDRTLAGGGVGDGVVTAFTADGSGLDYSTFLGGGDNDEVWAIALDADGSAYLTGYTGSSDFPTTPDAFDRVCEGCFFADVYVARLDATGSNLLYSTFLGGDNSDLGSDIDLREGGAVLIAGWTVSTDFPTTPNAFDRTFGGSGDAFVTELRPGAIRLRYSSFLGGNDVVYDYGSAVAADGRGTALVSGSTHSGDFPVTEGAYDDSYNGDFDAFVSRLRIPPPPAAPAR
jgi:hypothetical protein